jgi:three-Cys-motif partner protein
LAAPKQTIWELEPHTAAKHAILRRYLSAWLPILSHGGFQKLAYIDAFSGPGSYVGGEDGSPVIALKAMLDHKSAIKAQCHFDFVELDAERAAALTQAVEITTDQLGRPANAHIAIHQKTFEDAYVSIGAKLRTARTIPTLAFIDPFGWKGLPFSIVSELLNRPSTEVLINFMFEEINRFLDHPDQGGNFDKLFGCTDWRECASLHGPARNRCIRDLYARKLSENARYVRFFEMKNKSNATDYFLFFATNNILGLKKMKEAMWKVDQGGAFSFSDATRQDQLTFFVDEPNFQQLRALIIQRFKGREASVEQIEEFVVAETAFRETHFKRQILKPLEGDHHEGFAVVRAKPGRTKGSFPPGTVLKFA